MTVVVGICRRRPARVRHLLHCAIGVISISGSSLLRRRARNQPPVPIIIKRPELARLVGLRQLIQRVEAIDGRRVERAVEVQLFDFREPSIVTPLEWGLILFQDYDT